MNIKEFQPIVPGPNPSLSKDYMTEAGPGFALLGQACELCGKSLFPKTGVCPECRSTQVKDCVMPTAGVLYSWSVVHVAPKPWPTPYVIGYVDLPNGVRVFSHIGGSPENLKVDMPVHLEPAEIGLDPQGQPRPFFQFSAIQ